MLQLPPEENLGFITIQSLADALNGVEGHIQLPSFQRDAVWNEEHIEKLWDSLWQGYPVGSLLFASVGGLEAEGLAVRKPQVSQAQPAQQVKSRLGNTEYIIIDGQQRAIAMALGLRTFQKEDTARLWIDLGANSEGFFVVCSVQNPWGQNATRTQKQAGLKLLDSRLLSQRGELQTNISPLRHTWPVRQNCPVPLPDLLDWLATGRQGDWRELVPESRREAIACDDLEVVFDKLNRLLNSKIPVYLVKDLTLAQLSEVFQRLNKQGYTMTDEELFFSAVKMKWPEAHNLVWDIYSDPDTGRFLPPRRIIHLAVRLVAMAEPRHIRRLDLAEFERLTEKEPAQFDQLKGWLRTEPGLQQGRLHHCLKRARELLQYDPRRKDDPGLPTILLARLRWRVWHTLVAWLAHRDNVDDNDRREMIRYALFDHYFGQASGSAWERTPFLLAWKTADAFPGFEIYATLRLQGRVEQELRTVAEFRQQLDEAQDSTPPARLFKREIQLGLWTRRDYFQQWFPAFDPTHYGSEQDLPYDVDHILPKAYNNLRGRVRWKYGGPAPEFRRWRWRVINGPGNLRYWPSSLNRSDGKKNLADKYLLGPGERETPEGSLLRAYKLNNIADVREASEIDLENVPDWEVGANARKPYDWRNAARIKALRQATDNRRLTMYRRFYEGVDYAAWHQRFEPWLVEVIKNRVLDLWIQQAREDGNSEVYIYARDVQDEIGMLGTLPLIHQVFDNPEFLFVAGVADIRRGKFAVDEEFHWVISL